MSKAIIPEIREQITELISKQDQSFLKLLPIVTSYVANPMNTVDQVREGYPYTLSNIMELNGLESSHRCRVFKKYVQYFEDDSMVVGGRKRTTGRYGKESEIWFTPLGFWAAFDELRTDFSKKVRRLKNRVFDLAMQNIAKKVLQQRQQNNLLLTELENHSYNPFKVLAIELDMGKMIGRSKIQQQVLYTYSQRCRLWRIWAALKSTGIIVLSGDENRSSYVSTVDENTFVAQIYRF